MTLEEFAGKYGTHGATLIVRRAIEQAKSGKPADPYFWTTLDIMLSELQSVLENSK